MIFLDSKNIAAKELKEKLSLIPDEANIGLYAIEETKIIE